MWPFRRNRTGDLPWIQVTCGEEFPLEVHGESFHEPTLRALVLAGEHEISGDRITGKLPVMVCREPTNEHDANAVAVRALSGHPLGHVPRELAAGYSKALIDSESNCRVCCEAQAWGRLIDGDWNIGIWLSLPGARELGELLAEAGDLSGRAPGDILACR